MATLDARQFEHVIGMVTSLLEQRGELAQLTSQRLAQQQASLAQQQASLAQQQAALAQQRVEDPRHGEKLGDFVLTWYSFQDNTPCNSAASSSGRALIPFVSVAVPFRLLKEKGRGGTLKYGDHLFVDFLQGRTMPNGRKHTGWVQVDDFCGDFGDDEYCYQKVGGKKYPNVDLYIGDYTQSKIECDGTGPAGSGQEKIKVYMGPAPAGEFISDYGGAAKGKGKCGDCGAAKAEKKCNWHYTPRYEKWWDDVCKKK
jgi:hypothetical protein